MKNFFFSSLIFFSFFNYLNTEDAIYKPRRQKPSEIKQDIAEIDADSLRKTTDLIQSAAELQKLLIDDVADLADPVKNSFYAQATVDQLKELRDKRLEMLNSIECGYDQLKKITHKCKHGVTGIKK